MTSTWWFPDNTVLCNFASVDRLDVLREVLRGRGRWVEAIAYEASQSARHIPSMVDIASQGWLGEPIEIDDPKMMQAVSRTRRIVFGGNDNEPLKHLGEAQTCELIRMDPMFGSSWWITDDREALRYAQGQQITTRETIEIVSTAVVEGAISKTEGYDLMHLMNEQGRSMRLPVTPDELTR